MSKASSLSAEKKPAPDDRSTESTEMESLLAG